MVNRLRAFASSGTALATPWAEKITGRSPAGASASSLDEDDALSLERVDDVFVVDDLVAHVDRRAVDLERPLDHVDRAHDAGAEAARSAENDTERRFQFHRIRQPSLGTVSWEAAPAKSSWRTASQMYIGRDAPATGPPRVRRFRRPRRRARVLARLDHAFAATTATGSIGLAAVFAVDFLSLFWVARLGSQALIAAIGDASKLQFLTLSFRSASPSPFQRPCRARSLGVVARLANAIESK